MNRRTIHALGFLLLAAPACDSEADPTEVELRKAEVVAEAVAAPAGTLAGFATALEPSVPRSDRSEGAAGIDAGVEGASLTTNTGCIDFTWSGLAVTANFEHCTSPTTGAAMEGSISLGLSLDPFGLAVDFDDFSVDGETLDGFAVLTIDNSGLRVEAEIAYAGSENALAIDEFTVDAEAAGVAVDLAGALSTQAGETTVDADSLFWKAGECLPSAGVVDFTDEELAGTIEFLDTTPQDGVVLVTIVGLNATPLAVFDPC